jgi:dihydroorotate dehydrogenase (NAD+) catalytic subunit
MRTSRRPVLGNVRVDCRPGHQTIALLKVRGSTKSPGHTIFRSLARAESPTRPTRSNSACASLVGVGTALFYEPMICPQINQGIAAYLRDAQLTSVQQLVGTLQG